MIEIANSHRIFSREGLHIHKLSLHKVGPVPVRVFYSEYSDNFGTFAVLLQSH